MEGRQIHNEIDEEKQKNKNPSHRQLQLQIKYKVTSNEMVKRFNCETD